MSVTVGQWLGQLRTQLPGWYVVYSGDGWRALVHPQPADIYDSVGARAAARRLPGWIGPFESPERLRAEALVITPSGRLTAAQIKYLAEIRRDGERRFNGRARRPLETLQRAGLITCDWDLAPQVSGSGVAWAERVTARPVGLTLVHRADERQLSPFIGS